MFVRWKQTKIADSSVSMPLFFFCCDDYRCLLEVIKLCVSIVNTQLLFFIPSKNISRL